MNLIDKPIVWLKSEIKTPPFTESTRIEVGFLLRLLQRGDTLFMPHSRPMPNIGSRCNELRIVDENITWRIIYYIADDAIVILDVLSKKTAKTPLRVINICKKRLKEYQNG